MIEKGKQWGAPIQLSGDEAEASTDAELAQLLDTEAGRAVILTGGDLYFSLGAQASPDPYGLPIDLIEVQLDDRPNIALAAAHVIARRPFWHGSFAIAMNGTHMGDWNLGPKAHPNDGIMDTTEGQLGISDRLSARKRAHLGTHIPHPALRTRRVRNALWEFDRPTPIAVDGVAHGRAKRIQLSMRPDAGFVVLGPRSDNP